MEQKEKLTTYNPITRYSTNGKIVILYYQDGSEKTIEREELNNYLPSTTEHKVTTENGVNKHEIVEHYIDGSEKYYEIIS